MLLRKYEFPMPEIDGFKAVEEKYLELLNRRRNGERLDEEERDYFDYANNVLTSIE